MFFLFVFPNRVESNKKKNQKRTRRYTHNVARRHRRYVNIRTRLFFFFAASLKRRRRRLGQSDANQVRVTPRLPEETSRSVHVRTYTHTRINILTYVHEYKQTPYERTIPARRRRRDDRPEHNRRTCSYRLEASTARAYCIRCRRRRRRRRRTITGTGAHQNNGQTLRARVIYVREVDIAVSVRIRICMCVYTVQGDFFRRAVYILRQI